MVDIVDMVEDFLDYMDYIDYKADMIDSYKKENYLDIIKNFQKVLIILMICLIKHYIIIYYKFIKKQQLNKINFRKNDENQNFMTKTLIFQLNEQFSDIFL